MCHSRLLAYIRKPLAKSARRFRKTESGIAPFCAISLPHAQVLVRPRQVIAKAESLVKGDNPRFVVTNLPKQHVGSIHNVYEKLSIARVAIWRTASRNSSCVCLPTAPVVRRCAPISCGYIFLVRICADAGLAATGIERYAVHQRTMLDAAE